MTAHAKGPWKVRSHLGGLAIHDADGFEIAEVHVSVWKGEDVANARILGAAPRMYEILADIAVGQDICMLTMEEIVTVLRQVTGDE